MTSAVCSDAGGRAAPEQAASRPATDAPAASDESGDHDARRAEDEAGGDRRQGAEPGGEGNRKALNVEQRHGFSA